MYQQTRDLVRVQWHLRHKDIETLRHYVQELPLAMSRAALSTEQAARVRAFSRVADVMRRRALRGRVGHLGPTLPGFPPLYTFHGWIHQKLGP